MHDKSQHQYRSFQFQYDAQYPDYGSGQEHI
jgi:hypothetical protein